jgi:hypothetical protein
MDDRSFSLEINNNGNNFISIGFQRDHLGYTFNLFMSPLSSKSKMYRMHSRIRQGTSLVGDWAEAGLSLRASSLKILWRYVMVRRLKQLDRLGPVPLVLEVMSKRRSGNDTL